MWHAQGSEKEIGFYQKKYQVRYFLQPQLYFVSHILLLQPHHGSCNHILAPVVMNWLLKLHISSCGYFFAPAAMSLLLQPHLNT